jgi:patatin-like phospholipase/acyl hydrolase
MSDPNTVRVLSLSGGGERGYISLVFLQRFLNQWGMVGTLAQNFDVICGTSIGGICSLGFGLGKSVADLVPFFTEEGQWIFTIRTAEDVLLGSINASDPSNVPNDLQKVAIIADNDQFYKSVSTASNYGSARLKSVITNVLGTNTMANMQTNILIPSLRSNTSKAVFFSNADYPQFIGQTELAVNVALATSAAPLYLPPVTFGGNEYIDGGLYQNSPTGLGLTLAKVKRPTAKRACVLSIGTGTSPDHDFSSPPDGGLPFETSATTLLNLLTIAIPNVALTTDIDLFLRSQYTLDNLFYYSFNPVLTNTDLDNTTPAFLTYLSDAANTWYDNDTANITNFIGHLTA